MIVEGKNYVNGYHFCNRLSPKQNFVSLHHTIIWQKAAFVCCFQRVPTKCGADLRAYQTALWLVESGLQIVAIVSDVAVSQRDA